MKWAEHWAKELSESKFPHSNFSKLKCILLLFFRRVKHAINVETNDPVAIKARDYHVIFIMN